LATVTINNNAILTSTGSNAFSDTARDAATPSIYSITNCPALTTLGAFNAYTDTVPNPDYSGQSSMVQQVKLTDCSALTAIQSSTFYGCSKLASIDLAGCSSIAHINSSAFYGCTELTSIDFTPCKTALLTIDDYAFNNCTKLATIDFTDCTVLTDIRQYAFYQSGIESVILNTTALARIGISAFENCYYLYKIDLPGSLTNIGDKAFLMSGLRLESSSTGRGSEVTLRHTGSPAGITAGEGSFAGMHSTDTGHAKICFAAAAGTDFDAFVAWWESHTNWTKPKGAYAAPAP
jgi:hypothetical protein